MHSKELTHTDLKVSTLKPLDLLYIAREHTSQVQWSWDDQRQVPFPFGKDLILIDVCIASAKQEDFVWESEMWCAE